MEWLWHPMQLELHHSLSLSVDIMLRQRQPRNSGFCSIEKSMDTLHILSGSSTTWYSKDVKP